MRTHGERHRTPKRDMPNINARTHQIVTSTAPHPHHAPPLPPCPTQLSAGWTGLTGLVRLNNAPSAPHTPTITHPPSSALTSLGRTRGRHPMRKRETPNKTPTPTPTHQGHTKFVTLTPTCPLPRPTPIHPREREDARGVFVRRDERRRQRCVDVTT